MQSVPYLFACVLFSWNILQNCILVFLYKSTATIIRKSFDLLCTNVIYLLDVINLVNIMNYKVYFLQYHTFA